MMASPQQVAALQQQQLMQQQLLQQRQQQIQQQQMAAQQQPQQQPVAGQGAGDPTVGGANNLVVTGCAHATVGVIARGSYTFAAENHGKRAYKKDTQVNGLDVMIYYWDERDGPAFSGWWFGPKIGGDQVWAYHPDRAAQAPPKTGWKVPYDGPVDATFAIAPAGAQAAGAQAAGAQAAAAQAAAAQQAQWQQGGQQHQWKQQQAQQHQMQLQQKQQMFQQQQMEQRRRLEENKRKMEEANQKRMEEQQRKMQELKMQQEHKMAELRRQQEEKVLELKRQKDEYARKQEEERQRREIEKMRKIGQQRAAMSIRSHIGKVREATPENWDFVRTALTDAAEKELQSCGTLLPQVKADVDAAMAAGQKRIDQIEAARKKEEERKAAEERRKREQGEKALALLNEYADLVNTAEEAHKSFAAESEPLKNEEDLELDRIDAVSEACAEAGKDAQAKARSCMEFGSKHGAEMRLIYLLPKAEKKTQVKAAAPTEAKEETSGEANAEANAEADDKNEEMKVEENENAQDEDAKADGAEAEEKPAPVPELRELVFKGGETARKVEQLLRVNQIKTGKLKTKAMAKKQINSMKGVFKSYGKSKDGYLTKKELIAYAKGEFTFTLPFAEAEAIFKALAGADQGIPIELYQRIKTSVGIAREKAKDAERKEARLAKEKETQEKVDKIKAAGQESAKIVDDTEAKIKAADEATKPLFGKAKNMNPQEMSTLADEVADLITAAKDSLTSAEASINAIEEEVKEEQLKKIAAAETAKIKARLPKFSAVISSCDETMNKFRADIADKKAQQLENFRAEAAKLIRFYQTKSGAKTEDVYSAFDKTGAGKVNEAEFVQFFAEAKAKASEDEKAELPELSGEDLALLFKHLDDQNEAAIAKEFMMSMINCYVSVVKETVITVNLSVKDAKPIRRLDLGETLQVLEGPVKEQVANIVRLRVKSMTDDVEGWVTERGNQGTVFLKEKPGGLTMKVIKDTILTSKLEVADPSNKTLKKLKEGEVVAVLQHGHKEPSSGLTRMKVRTASGFIGWCTSVGSAGVNYLELC